jgi:hypothetical protein
MRRIPLASLAVLGLLGLLVPAFAQKDTRQSLLDSFHPTDRFRPKFEAVLRVKVWGELPDSGGKKVHLEKYTWSPEERFDLWFESNTKVRISLHQDFVGKSSVLRAPLPDRESHRELFNAIEPGKPFKLPIRFRMDRDGSEELMSIMVVKDGEADAPRAPERDDPEFVAKAEKYTKAMAELRKASAGKKEFAPKFEEDAQSTGNNSDEVASIRVRDDGKGYLQLKLRKRK